jgi:3-oxoacyl-[acyl-carrier-protein] synthase II
MSLGEGAGFLVLERRGRAAARGAATIATLVGFGLSGDGWHETSPDPKGAGVERAILGALADADLSRESIGYVNAHGSGTEANDHSEWLGVQRALGPRALEVPISSTKGALGHAQGAAGVLEAIVTLMAAQRGLVPPTLNFSGARLHGPPDPVGSDKPRQAEWDHALAINSAFGGSNVALLFSRARHEPVRRARQRVAVLGVGVVTPNGSRPGRVAPFSLRTEVPTADPRGLDPASTFLTTAAARALNDAGIAIRGSLRQRTGLFVGQTRGSPTSIVQFQQSIADRGLLHLSAAAFARIVLNAPAGFCSKLLSLRGPLSVVSTGAGSGLTALILGAGLLENRDDTDLLLAGACDEHHPENGTVPNLGDEGAACLVLANERGITHSRRGVRVWIAGHGIAGPGLLETAIAAAVRSSGVDPVTVPVFPVEPELRGRATGALLAVAEAARMLGESPAAHALVTMCFGRSLCAAVLLEAPGDKDAVNT